MSRLSATQREILEEAANGNLFQVWPSGPKPPYYIMGDYGTARLATVKSMMTKGLIVADGPRSFVDPRRAVRPTDAGRDALVQS